MAFQASDLRNEGTLFGLYSLYHYKKHYSVAYSIEHEDNNAIRTLSVCCHTGDNYLTEAETKGLLRYFGFDPTEEVKTSVCKHHGDPRLGDTCCYRQPISIINA